MVSSDDIASLKVEMEKLAAAVEGWSLKLAARNEIEYSKIPEPNSTVQSDSQLLNHNLHVTAQSQSAQKVLDELPIPTFILEMAQAAKTAQLDPTRGDYEPVSDTGVLTPNRQSNKSDSTTAKFQGFDIRIDSVSTLEKIWRKHGNIVENSVMRNQDIIAMSLESLATMVRILDNTSAMSLSDREVDYLVSTLSDLRHNRFKVDWLIPSVEKAEKFHTSRPLMESFNNLSQLCSQAKDRRTKLLEKLTKLDEEVNTWKEEMAKISNMIPSCGQVKFDEPIGSGLT